MTPHLAITNGTSRTAKSLIPNALKSGYQVTSIVRSAVRFNAQVESHDKLKVFELPSIVDVASLQNALRSVDVIYIAAMSPVNEPTTLVQDMVRSVISALQGLVIEYKSAPRIVLLSWDTINPIAGPKAMANPPFIMRFLRNNLLNHIYDDLERSHELLEEHSSWLEYVIVTPGSLVDVIEPAAQHRDWMLSTTEIGHIHLSYERLAAAMLSVLDQWTELNGKYVTPIPTSKVKVGWSDLQTQRDTIRYWFSAKVFRPMLSTFTKQYAFLLPVSFIVLGFVKYYSS